MRDFWLSIHLTTAPMNALLAFYIAAHGEYWLAVLPTVAACLSVIMIRANLSD